MSNRVWRATGRVIKTLALVFVFSVCALVLWRIFSSGDPDSMTKISVSKATYEAYEKHGDDLRIYRQNQNNITRAEKNYGYFSVTQVYIIPEANQIQVVFRYNNSTLKYVAEDLGLGEVPSREEDIFDISLAISTDLTPDRTDDNAYSAKEFPDSVSEARYFPSETVESDTKTVYNYRKYIFENVSLTDLSLAVYVDIYYKGNGTVPDYSEESMGTLCIYTYAEENIERGLTNADRDALIAWKEKESAK